MSARAATLAFLENVPCCPGLPDIEAPIRATVLREFGTDRGPRFYLRALECAQSLWRRGVPAQALLLLNRALGADLKDGDEVLADWPLPYHAVAWMLENRPEEAFIGNPRRHYQHLATRMVEPRKTQRSWRAWACWAIACEVEPCWPADTVQLENEDVEEPGLDEISAGLVQHGLKDEPKIWFSVMDSLSRGAL